MQPSDPFHRPPEDLPPLVRRPDEFQLPALVLPTRPESIPLVLPVRPRPPHPGFWMALVWCLVFTLLTQGTALVIMCIPIAWHLIQTKDERVLRDLAGGKLHESPLAVRAFAWGSCATEIVTVAFSWLIARLIVGRDWKRELGLVSPRLVHVVLVVFSAPAMMVLGTLVHGLAKQVLPDLKAAETTMKVVAEWPWWFSVLVIGVGPGVGEELWCRGFLGRGLVGRYGFVGGVLLTSMLFGLLHLDPPHVVAACAMGFLLHYVYLTTRCLWMSMLLHFLNNSAAAVLDNNAVKRYWPALEDLDEKWQPNLPLFAAIFFLLAAVVWALYVTRTRLTAIAGGPLTWKPPYPGAAAPPEGSLTVETIPRLAWLAVLPVLVGAGGVVAAVYLQ